MIDTRLARRPEIDAIEFQRELQAAPERVWRALTTTDGIAAWFGAPLCIEAHVGGSYHIQLTDDTVMSGTILELEPERLLVIAWREASDGVPKIHSTGPDDDTSELRFALAPHGSGTLFTLTHRLIRPGDSMNGFAGGWHAFVDSLEATLRGDARPDIMARYREMREIYDARFSEVDAK